MLVVRLVFQTAGLLALLTALFFVPAGTIHAWPAWAYLGLFTVLSIVVSGWFLHADPKLLERRLALGERGEQERTQRILQALGAPAFFGIFVVAGLEWRWMPAHMPAWVVLTGDALVVIGLFVCFLVFGANSFASSIVEISKEQRVITTGPYALVRHPMYTGGLVFIAGTPLALGSVWAEACFVPLFVLIVLRMLHEERFLSEKLPGYSEYMQKTRWRLVPGVW
jgi:protein-S-isoprenylcysteine O-methyltransferase Ste14